MPDRFLMSNLSPSFTKFSGPLPSVFPTSSASLPNLGSAPSRDSFSVASIKPRYSGNLLRFASEGAESKEDFKKADFKAVKAKLRRFELPLAQLDSLFNYGPLQLVKKFRQLPEGIKKQVASVVQELSPQFFAQLIKEDKMGLLEEGADWYMEYYTLQAFKRGILKQAAINALTDRVKVCLQAKQPVETVLKIIQLTLKPHQVQQFRTVLALKPNETTLARELLAALILKFTLQAIRGESSNGEAYTRSRIALEAEELMENLAKHDRYCPALVRLNNALFSVLPLPTRLFSWLPQKLIRHHLAEIARPSQDDLLRYSSWKQAIRNSVNYHTLPKNLKSLQTWSDERRDEEYQKRKSVFKVFELFFEAFVLKMANGQVEPESLGKAA